MKRIPDTDVRATFGGCVTNKMASSRAAAHTRKKKRKKKRRDATQNWINWSVTREEESARDYQVWRASSEKMAAQVG